MTNTLLQPLVDFVGYSTFQVLDEDKSNGRMRVRGIFQRANVKNGNGRVYSETLWNRVLNDASIQESLKKRLMLGEVEHPQDGMTNLSRVSHIVTKLVKRGNDIIGEAEILNTPSGRILQELFRANVPVGISSRGQGSSYRKGDTEYVDENNFVLETFDFVYKPSTPGAYTQVAESLASPFKPESPMEEKQLELKRLEVRAADILKQEGASFPELRRLHEQLVEDDAALTTIKLQNSDNEDIMSYAEGVEDKIRRARQKVMSAIEEHYRKTDRPFKTIVDESSGYGRPQDTSHPGLVDGSALTEAMERAEYWKSKAEMLERDYKASVELCQALKEEATKRRKQVKQLTKRLEEKDQRLSKAEDLLQDVVERSEKARVVMRIRDAIKNNPKLARFKSLLLQQESVEKVESTIASLVEGIGSPAHLKPAFLREMGDDEDDMDMNHDDEMDMNDEDEEEEEPEMGYDSDEDDSDMDMESDDMDMDSEDDEDDEDSDMDMGEDDDPEMDMDDEDDMDMGEDDDPDMDMDDEDDMDMGEDDDPEMDMGDEEEEEDDDMDMGEGDDLDMDMDDEDEEEDEEEPDYEESQARRFATPRGASDFNENFLESNRGPVISDAKSNTASLVNRIIKRRGWK